jgi:ABC-2 type transport system ATP-binding protein
MIPAISLRNVAKRFGAKTVLDGVDMEIPPGTIVGLLGTNGSGKTTLLKCAVGLLRPQGGECELLGEPSWNLSAAAKARLGYVPQVISLYPWMRVADLVRYTASFYQNWNESVAVRLMGEFELPAAERVGTLSVGQLQKLAILTAVAHEPDLLILDEPAASLDPLARRRFLQLIIDMAEPGRRTVLFSTHITSDLERVADRVAILKQGRIVHFGSLEELKEQTHLSLEDAFVEMHHV